MDSSYIILLVCFVFGIIALIYFYLPKARELYYVMFGKFRVDPKSPLTPDEQRKVLVGAVYTCQQVGVLNTLLPKVQSYRRIEILNQYWGIANSNEAHEALESLRDKGHRFFFPAVIALSKATSETEAQEILSQHFSNSQDQNRALEMYTNMRASVEVLQKTKMISSVADIERIGINGWDAGRLVFMTRLCHEHKLITEDEAWAYINAGDKIAHETLTSWDDMARSYVIGRCFWTGPDSMTEGLAYIVDDLITKETSPFKQHAF